MEWLYYLLLLACPLMMIFMMFGHGHGNKHGANHANHDNHHSKDFALKVESLEIENGKLRNELEELKSIVKKRILIYTFFSFKTIYSVKNGILNILVVS